MRYILFVVCFMFTSQIFGCVEQELGESYTTSQYDDLVFDKDVVNIDVTPDTDTIYLGFHRAKVDDITYASMYVVIERYSTAKRFKDYDVGQGLSDTTNRGFSISCNIDKFKGQFYMVINPEQITEHKYVKFYLYDPGHDFYNIMIVNLNPAK